MLYDFKIVIVISIEYFFDTFTGKYTWFPPNLKPRNSNPSRSKSRNAGYMCRCEIVFGNNCSCI